MTQTKTKKVKKTQHDLYHDLLNIKSALTDTADGVKERAENLVTDMIEDLQNRTSDIQEDIGTYVSEKPIQTIGIAVLFGIFLGKVIL